MLRVLRQLTPEEMRQVASQCGARAGASPEEIIRCLSRLCGVYVWGIFPAGTEETLLDHVGRRLGMTPMVPGPRGVAARERSIFGCYVRQGWETASPERRREVIEHAAAAWDSPSLPCPELPPAEDRREEGPVHPTLEALLAQTPGCRAVARALEQSPLPLPSTPTIHLPFPTPLRVSSGHQAMYAGPRHTGSTCPSALLPVY